MENSVEARKRKLAYFWAIVTIIACILVGAGVIMHSNNVLAAVPGRWRRTFRPCMRSDVPYRNQEWRT